MKKNIMCVAALIVAAIVSVTVLSCKKDNDEVVTKATNSEAQALLNRIEAFQTLRDAVNSGTKADGSMTVEEMRQALDLVSNYEHSEHMTYCHNTVLDTLQVAMPTVDGEGYVSNADVVATYNAFETALEKCMLGVNDGMNVPSCFSIIMPDTGAKDGNNIQVIFTRGKESTRPDNSTNSSDLCLYWGYGLGAYSPPSLSIFDDATDFLSQLFEFYEEPPFQGSWLIMSNVEYVSYVAYDYPYDTLGWVYWEPTTSPSCANHWLYVTAGEYDYEPYICWDELLCYYHTVNNIVENPNGVLHYSPTYHSPYFDCSFAWHHLYGTFSQKRSVRIHSLRVKYANYYWYTPSLD